MYASRTTLYAMRTVLYASNDSDVRHFYIMYDMYDQLLNQPSLTQDEDNRIHSSVLKRKLEDKDPFGFEALSAAKKKVIWRKEWFTSRVIY